MINLYSEKKIYRITRIFFILFNINYHLLLYKQWCFMNIILRYNLFHNIISELHKI